MIATDISKFTDEQLERLKAFFESNEDILDEAFSYAQGEGGDFLELSSAIRYIVVYKGPIYQMNDNTKVLPAEDFLALVEDPDSEMLKSIRTAKVDYETQHHEKLKRELRKSIESLRIDKHLLEHL